MIPGRIGGSGLQRDRSGSPPGGDCMRLSIELLLAGIFLLFLLIYTAALLLRR